jgi:hypothetical protein
VLVFFVFNFWTGGKHDQDEENGNGNSGAGRGVDVRVRKTFDQRSFLHGNGERGIAVLADGGGGI